MKKKHNFLEHYQQGGVQPIEDKPINVRIFDENLQKHSITFSQRYDFYNFYDPREIIPDFLQVFQSGFIPRRNLECVRFNCNFPIIN